MVSHPPTPGPDPEITIDLDGDPEPNPEPEPSPSRPRISNAALAFAAAVIMLAAGAVTVAKWLPGRPPVAEETVRSFLEAVSAGEVDEALALAGEADGAEQFLVAEALDDRWEIVEIAQVAYHEDVGDQGATAEVYAEIEAYDGTRLGYRYWVRLDGGDPVIDNALGRAEYQDVGLGALELNGYVPDLGDHTQVLLLPGVYEMYGSEPPTLESHLRPVLALGDRFLELGGERPSNSLPWPWIQMSAAGRETLDRAVRARLDDCAVRAPSENCPFALPEDERITIPADAAWEITAYPQVGGRYTNQVDADEWSFELFTAEPGSVEVEAVVAEPDGGERRTTLSCAIWVDGVYAVFDAEGGVTLTPGSAAADHCRAMVEVE